MKRLWLSLLVIWLPQALLAQSQHCRDGFAEYPRVDPRNPDVICLPELGRMYGTINCPDPNATTEHFGQQVFPIGDCNHDSLADWIVSHHRCDTSVFIGYRRFPDELLLYHGVRGGLPTSESGERIGSMEILSSCRVLAAGDWDGDHHVDLAIRVELFGDTSSGNVIADFDIATLVIFWGQSDGSFTVTDTTRLSNTASSIWLGIFSAVNEDLDHDGVADLAVLSNESFVNGKVTSTAPLLIFRGHSHVRWGRDGVSRTADWRWWNPPPMHSIASGDQDGDGALDLYLHEPDFPFSVSVLYGNHNGLPDTTDVQTIALTSIGARASEFLDVTGDGIPELIMTTSTEYKVKVFLGLRGQRLLEQYGSGNDAPQPDKPQWWGKPWAEVWQPKKINDNWFGTADILYDLGDINFDGVGDICIYNIPWLTFYCGGQVMDSLIDGMIDGRPAGVTLSSEAGPRSVAVLGDIDGSGVPTIAEGSNGILFVKPSRDVPKTGVYREIPTGTGPASVSMEFGVQRAEALQLEAIPNPSDRDMRLRWSGQNVSGRAAITITNENGEEVEHLYALASEGEVLWHTAGLPAETYFATIRMDTRTATAQVIVR